MKPAITIAILCALAVPTWKEQGLDLVMTNWAGTREVTG